ncbi:hypothetical protein K0M31_005621 [Melipona bicolor]|uniref:Uncharacterized protein n=1 Tax=Melipona bicolor TaxID=60889 RepID=A0AA40KLV2_9HYME|nr:hypothetical protein K0M31_005621 [Melipona bicolor]
MVQQGNQQQKSEEEAKEEEEEEEEEEDARRASICSDGRMNMGERVCTWLRFGVGSTVTFPDNGYLVEGSAGSAAR